ncbi:MAG TPA: CBS domain-containing protein [Methanoregulaceae archaeon]|nr:CBS domain-containing protein [Methanoregulaceae archaeon]HPD75040.1 CBS domain-containing protein [Methanoregulaceae archaeon]HRY75671.1 CBS domain-containing protein [Methanoregulaceae archaeon]
MRVQDIMTKNPVTCSIDTPLREAVGLLRKFHIGGLPVMDGSELAGIITESDIFSQLETSRISDDLWLPSPLEIIEIPIREYINWEKTRSALSNIGDTPVKKVMTHRVVTATEDMDIEAAASLMLKEGIARLPVLRGKTLVGIITRADIVQGVGRTYDSSVEGV